MSDVGRVTAGHLLLPKILSLQCWEGKLASTLPESNMKTGHEVSLHFFSNFDLIRSIFISQKGEIILGVWNSNYFKIKNNMWNYVKNEMILKNDILFP